jgi:uncharacterized protein involved in exopolysaccharide biosynthesis
MSALEFIATLRRRWYILALVALCTMAAVFAVHKRTIVYEACQGLYVTGPPLEKNVYLNSNGALPMVAGMITTTVMSQPVQQQIHSAGAANYIVEQTNDGDIRSPVYDLPSLQVCANSTSSQGVVAATRLVTANLYTELNQLQATQRIPHKKHVSTIKMISLFPAIPVPVFGRSSLAYLGVMIFGAVSGVALALWSDPWLTRRGRRRRPRGSKG